ncbi:DUF6162 family protein [Fusobacterium animalis]|uniref:DUF6162 family protein n=1 Tax=Fusobacterium animalis TaxID=76859 RepID=UPI0005187E5B|nr:hypothetical protein [Fusobacterium animalis]
MIKINTYIVKPLSSKKENIFLILAFFILISLAAIVLKIRHRTDYEITLKDNEIVSYEILNNIELGVYSDIKNSLVDISQLKDENNSLPSLKVLAEEEIPPYFKDVTWEERGAVEWTTFKHDNEDYFIGRGNGKVGTFVVKFNNENIDESDIFYMKETPSFEDIEKNFEKYEHILKKIVPYTGNDERKKFTGE